MISEEDSRLFEAAKRAQVSRNTAIHVIENTNSSRILAGAFVRVLLEMPTRNEGYVVARIHSTTAGEPYSGFSTNPAQTTNVYLMLELPPPLAAINGVQYQLNSVSNSSMGEGEFRDWLQMIRNEPTLRVPTVQGLKEVTARLHPYEVSRHRSNSHVSANGSMATNGRAGVVDTSGNVPHPQLAQQQQQQRSLSAHGAARQRRQSLAASSQTMLIPPMLQDGAPLPDSGDALLRRSSAAMYEGDSSGVIANAESSASAAGSNSNYNVNNRLGRQGTVMTRDYNRNPREDGQASHEMSNAEVPVMSFYTAATGSQQEQQQRTMFPLPHGGGGVASESDGGPALAATTSFMTRGATDPNMESEDEEMERRLRQEIMNHLAQECVLFPKDAQGYKLSRLRLLERDMIEYLQHVRDEIQGKQENCIVCMDHVPTVILLPCKHKVMCRLCAPSCPTCPVCRSKIAEMFEPEEI
ncbi:C3HC4 type (RING finger) containing protein [Leishmania donovani]|uniref:Plus-3_domain/Zinc_finger_C3HC4_type_(RING_finger )_containing_protein_putative/Pfam:PF03126/Pfam:PF13920 n=1 Tax=Leishmania donovani TaxID=5661 RepID=A0A6J8F477_LEIDO|nr:C3HC4 type (RING finger) containing protein [Leishmania donovani]VDZ42451.1 Plus-3_domain/Zinc_finger_C3HC4_type_(RING_finger)_containing_protein_putative/Pfam:PF03126/Pfam:PF13920 [Leishmania donovani]